jgi:hypothetical protein
MDQKPIRGAIEVPPWEQPGAYRRDCASHRGELLELLGLASILLSCCGFITLGVSALVGLPLGFLVMYLARCDLAQMKLGKMDPHGEPMTDGAWYQGCCGALVALAALALGVVVLMAWAEVRSGGGFIH